MVDEVGVWGGKDVRDQGCEGPALAREHVLLVVVAVSVTGGKYRLRFGLIVDHRWFSFEDLIPLPLSSGPVLEDLLSFDPRGSFLSNLEISRISPCHGDLLINNSTRYFLSVIKRPGF